MTDTWRKTIVNETYYTPYDAIQVESVTNATVWVSGSSSFMLELAPAYCDIHYKSDRSDHSTGVQVIVLSGLSIDISSLGGYITGAKVYGVGFQANLGNLQPWVDIRSNTATIYFTGLATGFTAGQYYLVLTSSSGGQYGLYFELAYRNGTKKPTFRSVFTSSLYSDYTSVFSIPAQFSLMHIGNSTYTVPYRNSRYLLCTDELGDGWNKPYAQASDGTWWIYDSDTAVFTQDEIAESQISSYYSQSYTEVKYRKYSGTSYTDISLGSQKTGSSYTAPTDPGTYDHHTFTGWKYNSQSVSTGSTFTSYPNQTLLTSVWAANEYTVTYVTDGTVTSETVTYPESVTLPTASKQYFTFDGWYDSDGNLIGKSGAVYTPVSDITLYAHFTAISFTVTYVTDGSSVTSPVTVNYPSKVTLPSTSKTHYSFNGWYDSDGNLIGKSGSEYQPTADITLTARFTGNTYVTTFSTSGSSVTQTVSTVYPATITLPSTSKTHYSFNGWYDSQTGGSLIGTSGAVYTPVSDLTLYAQFTANRYTVTYVTDGSSVTSPVTVSYPEQVTAPTTSKEHYSFNGWFTTATGSSLFVSAGSKFTPTSDITLYAQFTGITYRTTFSTTGSAVSPSYVDTVYPATITLPSTQKDHYTMQYWADTSGTNVGTPGSEYLPTSNSTLTAVFKAGSYTVTFYDADGSDAVSYSVEYPNEVSIPTPPTRTAYTFTGWVKDSATSQTVVISPSVTSVIPTADVSYYRQYTYSRTLRTYTGAAVSTVTGTYPNTAQLPTDSSHSTAWDVTGYRIKGFNSAATTPSISKSPDVAYTSAYVPDLSDTFTSLYAAYQPAVLKSITLPSLIEVSKDETSEVSVSNGSIVFDPSDYLGKLSWTRTGGTSNFSYLSGSDSVLITGLSATTLAVGLTATAPAETWNTSGTKITSNFMQVGVSELIPVTFYTTTPSGETAKYLTSEHYDSSGVQTNIWYVEKDLSNNYSWVSRNDHTEPTPLTFPPNPERTGFTFSGWLSAEGELITADRPPQHPVDVYAKWIQKYEQADRDMLIFQQFNKEGNIMQLQMDLGLIKSSDETFSISLTTTPTPTMSSDKTFITDLYCTETINVKIIRQNPKNIQDTSDNSLNWSNSKWITQMRSLTDRWQAETDGIKFLYLPRGLKKEEIGGTVFCYGTNYDMLGYILPRFDSKGTVINTGLIFGDNDEYVLMGYNCLITSYSDTYSAGTPDTVEVNMILTLGGMVSQYQAWADGMVLK